MKRRTVEAGLLGLAGLLIGMNLPTMAERDAPRPTTSPARAPVAQTSVTSSAEGRPRSTAADACVPDTDLTDRLDSLTRELDEERAFQRKRWGEPTTPPEGWDPVAEEQRFRAMLEGLPDRRWSTVDCSHHPCVGAFLTQTQTPPDEWREQMGLPHAVIHVGTWGHGDVTTYVAGIAFFEEPADDPLVRRWSWRLIERLRHRRVHDIGAVARGHELAE